MLVNLGIIIVLTTLIGILPAGPGWAWAKGIIFVICLFFLIDTIIIGAQISAIAGRSYG